MLLDTAICILTRGEIARSSLSFDIPSMVYAPIYRCIACALIALPPAAFIGVISDRSVAAAAGSEQCLDQLTCPVTYMRLATQETEPFFFYGEEVTVTHRRYKDYRDAIQQFPDVRSCLIPSERPKPKPDLRRMDWTEVKSFHDIEVCVFRIAMSIQDIDMVKAWLRNNDFIVGREVKQRSDDYVPMRDTDPVFIIDSTLSVENFRKIVPRPWIWRIIGIERVYNFSLSILFSRTGQVVGVSSIVNME